MADVELVIKLPEEVYEMIMLKINTSVVAKSCTEAEKIIANGTPLPKGHGRLIDADELIEGKVSNDWTRIQAECANTIIEADAVKAKP